MANPLYDSKQVSDFERYLGGEIEYCRESNRVANFSGAAVQLEGKIWPVKQIEPGVCEVMTALETQTPAGIYGFLVGGDYAEIKAGATTQTAMPVLVNGPAGVSYEAFPEADPVGAAYAAADFETFCAAANPPIKVHSSASALVSEPYKL